MQQRQGVSVLQLGAMFFAGVARARDGLFLKLAEQERLIRKDPVARTTDILKTMFGG